MVYNKEYVTGISNVSDLCAKCASLAIAIGPADDGGLSLWTDR